MDGEADDTIDSGPKEDKEGEERGELPSSPI